MKTNDIHICAFPRSGITYLGFLLTAARLHQNGIALQPTMYNIDFLLIDTHKMRHVTIASIWRDGIGDFLKTHSLHIPAPNVVYLIRSPVDTLRSYFHFRRQLGSQDSMEDFLRGEEGVRGWIKHVSSWLIDNNLASQSIFVIDYDQLFANPREQLLALGEQLGIRFSDESLEFALQLTSLERMRHAEASFRARNPVSARFNLNFVRRFDRRRGDEFTPEQIREIERAAGPVYAQVTRDLAHLSASS
ncbi:MAG: sulfotransferase domain-containing protein [Proteobacteria bacterium]|nr:sulfotransferase domain-containing protein [Pseudomonadota bacterium]